MASPPGTLSRRSLLSAGGALTAAGVLTAGCTGAPRGERAEHRQEDGQARAERRLREQAAAAGAALLARYDATAAAHPALAGTLAPHRAVTAAHLDALRAPAEAGRSGNGSGAGMRGGNAPAAHPVPEPPAEPEAALAALAEAEQGLAESRLAALAGAPPATARLLASLAAANAVRSRLLAPSGAAERSPA
ncbi:hypothetical protein [Streptomyces aidingensis]|uniref:hypothetical protein n=1 Tax=Streptomyces aidingensis TaxID=910347 RepID=UPI001FEA697A|nr:hypothetical protein [Streptomyces aidingensis]